MILRKLVEKLLEDYVLRWNGIHGVSHWARVLENGRRLSRDTGARIEVVELFAIFHDCRRTNEGRDPGHGLRGAECARSLRSSSLDVSDEDFDLLYTACAGHTDGKTEGDVTVRTSWDADRLDLRRAGIDPYPPRLCTDVARTADILKWANRRSERYATPDLVQTEWGIDLDS
jgi:uncharacterized protein